MRFPGRLISGMYEKTTVASTQQLIGVQYLRAIAALMVAYFHALEQIPAYAPLLKDYCLGDTNLPNGVSLFFVISGFIMVLTSSRATPREFAMRRLIRIVPLYWTLTATLVGLALWKPALLRTTVASVEYVAKSLTFIPYANPGQNGQLFPLLVPGWSLNLEMFFYAVFALALFLPTSRRIAATGLVFMAVVLTAPLLANTHYASEANFFGDYRVFEFLFGMIIAELYRRGLLEMSVRTAVPLTLLGFIILLVGLPFLHLPLESAQQVLLENGLPAVFIVVGTLALEQTLRRHALRFLAYLGDASYSMYLSHLFFLGAVRVLWTKIGMDYVSLPHAVAFAIVCLAATIVGAVLVYRYVEMPLLTVFQRLYKKSNKPSTSAAEINK